MIGMTATAAVELALTLFVAPEAVRAASRRGRFEIDASISSSPNAMRLPGSSTGAANSSALTFYRWWWDPSGSSAAAAFSNSIVPSRQRCDWQGTEIRPRCSSSEAGNDGRHCGRGVGKRASVPRAIDLVDVDLRSLGQICLA